MVLVAPLLVKALLDAADTRIMSRSYIDLQGVLRWRVLSHFCDYGHSGLFQRNVSKKQRRQGPSTEGMAVEE